MGVLRAVLAGFRVVDKAFRAWTKARYDHVIQLPVLPSQGERFLARYRVR